MGSMSAAGLHITPPGPRVPRQGNRLTRALGRALLRLFRWRAEGAIPDREKFVAVVAPHTTGWDFPIFMVTMMAMGVRVSWLGVNWLFRYPLMQKLGGIPVDRQAPLGVVPQAIEAFKSRRRHALVVSPEGSRKKVVPWKTGFYRIAHRAGVPILLVTVDQQNKHVGIGPAFDPSGDYEADMAEHVRPVYAEFVDRYPDNFGI